MNKLQSNTTICIKEDCYAKALRNSGKKMYLLLVISRVHNEYEINRGTSKQ